MKEKTFNKLAVVFILSLMLLFASASVLGQSLKNYKGDTVYKEQVTDIRVTSYKYEDKNGVIYTVYVTSKNKFFIYKKSQKTGEYYKYYLPKKYQEQMKNLSPYKS